MYSFTEITDPAGLAQIADTLSQDAAAGRLGQVIDRWIYTACLVFGLDLADQRRTCFSYAYSVYQAEYSRNLLFAYGGHMDRVFNAMLDRTRSRLDIPALRTLFGARRRPGKYGTAPSPRVGVALETPAWDLTVFKVHFGLLTLKGYTKGARVLRFEAITHNTRQLGCRRALDRFPQIVARLAGMCQRFCTVLDCVDIGFLPGGTLDQLPLPAQLGASRVGGIDVNKPRIRAALAAVLALAPSPDGFTVAEMTAKVHAMTGQTHATYNTRQAAYDLRKLRGKQLISKPPRNPPLLPARPGRPDHIGAAHPPGPRHRPDPGRRQDPPAQPRPDQAEPHRPGLRTSPNRHGHPVQAPGHPARSSHGIASAKPNFWRSWNLKLLDFVAHLLRNGCGRLIFSSSAAIYQAGGDLSVDEDSVIDPQSPYARTKAVCEAMFADIAAAQPIRVLSLRYFNPVGADPKMRTGLQLRRPTRALGKMIQAQQEGVPFVIIGTDWPTRDGTGLGDYVHVWDLAAAHVAALTRFDALAGPATAINLGTGTGTTVRELLAAFNRVADRPVGVREAGRRPGDVAGACSRIDRAERLLGWRPQYELAAGISHSLQWAALREEILPG